VATKTRPPATAGDERITAFVDGGEAAVDHWTLPVPAARDTTLPASVPMKTLPSTTEGVLRRRALRPVDHTGAPVVALNANTFDCSDPT